MEAGCQLRIHGVTFRRGARRGAHRGHRARKRWNPPPLPGISRAIPEYAARRPVLIPEPWLVSSIRAPCGLIRCEVCRRPHARPSAFVVSSLGSPLGLNRRSRRLSLAHRRGRKPAPNYMQDGEAGVTRPRAHEPYLGALGLLRRRCGLPSEAPTRRRRTFPPGAHGSHRC